MSMTHPLNVRIAELEGWTNIVPSRSALAPSSFVGDDPKGERRYLPDWTGDLNLMHELEKGLDKDSGIDYNFILDEIVKEANKGKMLNTRVLGSVHATADQKAKAWVRVKEGKG